VVSRPDRHPIDDATEIVDRVLDLIGPPPSAPADPTETLARTTVTNSCGHRVHLGQAPRDPEAALAASQEDLTAAKAENADWRATAERYLEAQEQLARELATARYRNRILTAGGGAR
jgi:hypothetical protein